MVLERLLAAAGALSSHRQPPAAAAARIGSSGRRDGWRLAACLHAAAARLPAPGRASCGLGAAHRAASDRTRVSGPRWRTACCLALARGRCWSLAARRCCWPMASACARGRWCAAAVRGRRSGLRGPRHGDRRRRHACRSPRSTTAGSTLAARMVRRRPPGCC
ncbi:MAG: hypothetical protein MZV65_29740 [Chromatiales bacterium]|nr:hypothetical protein [Chromatiales bacterium]